MIDRTQLTEALAHADAGQPFATVAEAEALMVAARWARDFPTDEQVEAAANVFRDAGHEEPFATQYARAVLEAVTMIGDEK
jgi:hypothetical protein